MNRLHVRMKLKEGKEGIPMPDLAEFASRATALFDQLARDLKLKTQEKHWIAKDFENGSLAVTVEYRQPVPEDRVHAFERLVPRVAQALTESREQPPGVSNEAWLKAKRFQEALEPGEIVRLMVPDRRTPGQYQTEDLVGGVPEGLADVAGEQYYGFVQGYIRALNTEEKRPYLQVHDVNSGRTVRCYFAPERYKEIHAIAERLAAPVNVEGWMTIDAKGRTVLDIETIAIRPNVTREAIRRLFGAAPNITGPLTTQEYMDEVRGRG